MNPISRSTLYNIQKKYLRYSYKRITQYISKPSANLELKRIFFVKRFLEAIEDETIKLLVLDEVGFGTNPLRHYGYSHIG